MALSPIPSYSGVNPTVLAVERLHSAIEGSTYRLASGNRIREIGDDAASLSIAQTLQAQVSGLREGLQNGNRADSLLRVARGGLEAIRSTLEQLRALAEQADSNGLTERQRDLLDTQFRDLARSIDTTVARTRFHNVALLDGSASPFLFLAGNDGNSIIRVTIDAVDTASLFGGPTPNIATQPEAQAAIPVVQDARNTVQRLIAEVSANQLAIDTARQTLSAGITHVGGARNELTRTNLTEELPINAALRVRQEAALSISAQTQGLPRDLLALLQLDFPVFDFLAEEA